MYNLNPRHVVIKFFDILYKTALIHRLSLSPGYKREPAPGEARRDSQNSLSIDLLLRSTEHVSMQWHWFVCLTRPVFTKPLYLSHRRVKCQAAPPCSMEPADYTESIKQCPCQGGPCRDQGKTEVQETTWQPNAREARGKWVCAGCRAHYKEKSDQSAARSLARSKFTSLVTVHFADYCILAGSTSTSANHFEWQIQRSHVQGPSPVREASGSSNGIPQFNLAGVDIGALRRIVNEGQRGMYLSCA